MPDRKLTGANLREHLRLYGAVYAVLLIVACFVANLLWTMTAPQIPEDQRILIYLADAWSDVAPLEPLSEKLLGTAQTVDPAIHAVDFESLIYADPETDSTGVMVLMTRLAAGEGDIFLAGKNAMDALISSGACLPLDEYYEDGWLNQLEPMYANIADSETEEVHRVLVGLKLDSLTKLQELGAFYTEGACLALIVNSPNIDSSMKVAEGLVETLTEGSVAP